MKIAVLSLAALSGLTTFFTKKQKPVTEHMCVAEVERFEDNKDPLPDFVDYSGGTWGI